MSEMYVPVSIESIEPVIFPDVALYLKSGGNYVLYKSHGRDFFDKDSVRLKTSGVEFLYVSAGEMEIINTYMEANAERLLKSDNLSNRAKGRMIYQTSVNFVGDIFTSPDKVADMPRSRRLLENLLLYMSNDPDALGSLESVISHNYHTFVHSLQVTTLALMMHSEAYMLSRDEMLDVGIGSLLHDFGKTFVPKEILTRSRLDDSELAILKRHPEEGYRYLKERSQLGDISLSIVRYHHERLNGTGYPYRLRETEIPRSAQVVGVCDVYCSLVLDNTGRKALPPEMAIRIMKQEMQGSFNPLLLGVLEKLVCPQEEPAADAAA